MQDSVAQARRQTDQIDPARAHALVATLGLDLDLSEQLPAFFHHIYFWDAQPETALGADGHPKVGGLIPDMGLPRRMWAAGRLKWHAPLRMGAQAEKTTVLENAVQKQGRSGPLGFVTLRHDIWQAGRHCLTEWQDLVYRGASKPAEPAPPPTDAEHHFEVQFSTTQLFRYSALTFNGHRIHYDPDYARDNEGYGGLVVHGPLLAQRLILLAAEHAPLRGFQFRATAPLIQGDAARLCRSGATFWVEGARGGMHMQASAVW